MTFKTTAAADGRADRPGWLAFLGTGLFLVATAITLGKPGLPAALRGDEAAYLTLATSLAVDGDALVEAADLERLYSLFPYTGEVELPIRFGADGATVDRPRLYPLLAVPFLALFGANGPPVLNILLVFAAAVLLLRHLEAYSGQLALLAFAAFGLSAVFPYLFWIHPTALWVLLGTLSVAAPGNRPLAVTSGLAGALLVGQLPSMALLLPAVAWQQHRHGRSKTWLIGLVVGAVIALGLLGAEGRLAGDDEVLRKTATLEHPQDIEALERPEDTAAGMGAATLGRAEGSLPRLILHSLVERRSGMLPYFPLLLLVPGGLLTHRRRLEGWQFFLLAGLAAHIVWVTAHPLPGVGGELIGDPAKAAAYPAFFLLLRRLPSMPVLLGAFALATLSLGTALVSCLGSAMAYGAAQSHSRGGLIGRLPLAIEHVGAAGIYSVGDLGGAADLDARLWWPTYAAEVNGDELWLLGGERVELFLDLARPIEQVTSWRLRNLAPGNVVKISVGDLDERLAFPRQIPAGGQGADLEALLENGIQVSTPEGRRFIHRLVVTTRFGSKPFWRQGPASTFYLGTALTFFGAKSHLVRDVYAAEALGCGSPPEVFAGEDFKSLARIANRSRETWNHIGAARVRLGQRWHLDEGTTVEGPRADLEESVAAGEEISLWLETTAPPAAGDHRLELDLIYENVAWFADRRGQPLCQVEVTVLPAPTP